MRSCYFFDPYMSRERGVHALDSSLIFVLQAGTTTTPSPLSNDLHPNGWIKWSTLEPVINARQHVGAREAFRGSLPGRPGDVLVRLFKLDAAGGAAASAVRFNAEIKVVMKLRHPNLLSVVGFSAIPGGGGMRALVTEYPANGTLEEGLETLTWKERVGVAAAMAGALQYLHTAVMGDNEVVTPVIYRDLTVRKGPAGTARDVSRDSLRIRADNSPARSLVFFAPHRPPRPSVSPCVT